MKLGDVKWRAGWRQYVFMPYDDTLYSYDCLEEIAAFVLRANEDHREAADARRRGV